MTEPTSDHERYAEWDGAYVLGALSPTDRQEYERHLAGCPDCQAAIAAIAPLPGLLARLDPGDADALLAEEPDEAVPALPVGLERRLLAAVGHAPVPFWRRTSTRVGLGLAAAAAVAAAVVVPVELGTGGSGGSGGEHAVAVALQQTVASPLTAEVAFTPTSWGTRVDMTCRYAPEPYDESRSYALYLVDSGGRETLVSRWHARPGQTARTSGSTDLAVADISEVQLRDGVTGRVLLTGTPS